MRNIQLATDDEIRAPENVIMHYQVKDQPAAQTPKRRVLWALTLVANAGLLTSACDELLQVEVPGEVEAATLNHPSMAPVLVAGVIADFECAFANYTLLAGSVGDEIMNASVAAVYNNYDRRFITPSESSFATGSCASGTGLYSPLSTARFVADDIYQRLERFSDSEVPNRTSLMGTVSAYGGYSLVLFGEGFCETAIDEGPVVTPTQVLGLAEERFTRAIQHAQASNNTDILGMAYVGRARARLSLGNLAGAAADARQVPPGFRRDATYSAVNARRENKLFTFTHRDRWASIDPSFWDVTWDGERDPRVDVIDTDRRGIDELTPLVLPNRYTSVAAPIPIATWEEAQLIIAEAEGGQTAVTIINDLLQRAGLTPTFSASSDAEIKAGVIEQRRRQLFLQSHRLGDMIRYGLPFSTGVHPWKLTQYGTSTCFPLPDVERFNNPNIG